MGTFHTWIRHTFPRAGVLIPTNTDLHFTPEETKAFSQLFKVADTEGKGIVTPQVAVALMSKSKLPQTLLSEVSSVGGHPCK